jgi:hypothetical protein
MWLWAFWPLLAGATKMMPANETVDATSSNSQWLESHSHLVCLLHIKKTRIVSGMERKGFHSEEWYNGEIYHLQHMTLGKWCQRKSHTWQRSAAEINCKVKRHIKGPVDDIGAHCAKQVTLRIMTANAKSCEKGIIWSSQIGMLRTHIVVEDDGFL